MYEKGGKRHQMPAHLKLEAFIDEYLAAAGIRDDDGRAPSSDQKGRRARGEAYEQRLQGQARCPVFRATGITAYLCPAAPSKTQAWPRTKARAPPSSTTAPVTRLPSTRVKWIRI
jgi:hypothetical protein